MVFYYLGWFNHSLGNKNEALGCFEKGSKVKPDYCFPNRIEDVNVLNLALAYNASDARAAYYLGCLWFDKRQYKEAIDIWELSAKTDPTFSTVFRNLGISYFNKRSDPGKALKYFEMAFALNKKDARVFMELDQLYKRLNKIIEN